MSKLSEASLQSALLKKLRLAFPGFVIFKHSEIIQTGVPDVSVNGRNKTVWLEIKLAKPHIKAKGLQTRIMKQMGRNCSAYYIVYQVLDDGRIFTSVVHPSMIDADVPLTSRLRVREGIDHDLIIEFLRDLYGNHN